MKSYKNAVNRAILMLVVIVELAFVGTAAINAQGKGRAKGTSAGPPRPEVNRVQVEKPAKPATPPLRLKPQPPPKPKPARPKPPKPRKPIKPFNPSRHDKGRHGAHKRCVKDCNRAHENAIRACRGERGPARAACERAANQTHRNCVRGCPR